MILLVPIFGFLSSFRGLIAILQKNVEKVVSFLAKRSVSSLFVLFHDLYPAQFECKAAPRSVCCPVLICIGDV